MQLYRSLDDLYLQRAWLTIGVFDGVHRGHQEIIRRLTQGAAQLGVPSVVMTFSPHPASVLTGREIKCLTTLEERVGLLGPLGVKVVIAEPFTHQLSGVSAHDFMLRLKQHLGLERLLIGYDFALGKGREGNVSRLSELGEELGYDVEIVPGVGDESGVFSSTAIRQLVANGEVGAAASLLGRPYCMSGRVIHGDHRGRSLGFPTANLEYSSGKVLPANGIYSCWACLDGTRLRAAVNIGLRPTVSEDQTVPNLEAYLLDFDHEIYGKTLDLEFVARLRDELKFPSLQALIEQMRKDVAQVRTILSE